MFCKAFNIIHSLNIQKEIFVCVSAVKIRKFLIKPLKSTFSPPITQKIFFFFKNSFYSNVRRKKIPSENKRRKKKHCENWDNKFYSLKEKMQKKKKKIVIKTESNRKKLESIYLFSYIFVCAERWRCFTLADYKHNGYYMSLNHKKKKNKAKSAKEHK